MKTHLTDLSVRALRPVAKQTKVWDTGTRGFGVRHLVAEFSVAGIDAARRAGVSADGELGFGCDCTCPGRQRRGVPADSQRVWLSH